MPGKVIYILGICFQSVIHSVSRLWETLVHELSFCKAQPPLAWFVRVGIENLLDDPGSDLVSQLLDVSFCLICFISVGRLSIHSIQHESWVAWDVEVLYCQRIHFIFCFFSGATPFQLFQTFLNVKSNVNQSSVSRAFDLIISKENIGSKKINRLINDVIFVSIQFWSWTSLRLCLLQRQQSHFAQSGITGEVWMVSHILDDFLWMRNSEICE